MKLLRLTGCTVPAGCAVFGFIQQVIQPVRRVGDARVFIPAALQA
jgi:hypothetical protein